MCPSRGFYVNAKSPLLQLLERNNTECSNMTFSRVCGLSSVVSIPLTSPLSFCPSILLHSMAWLTLLACACVPKGLLFMDEVRSANCMRLHRYMASRRIPRFCNSSKRKVIDPMLYELEVIFPWTSVVWNDLMVNLIHALLNNLALFLQQRQSKRDRQEALP